MKHATVSVISIYPDPARPLAVDLKDLMGAIQDRLPDCNWHIRNLEWLGTEDSEALCERVEAARPEGVWLSSQQLMDQAQKVYQTIDGEFVAFPREINTRSLVEHDWQLGNFPASEAVLAIVAIDGCYFDVYAKDTSILERLKHFTDVRTQDPSDYFPV